MGVFEKLLCKVNKIGSYNKIDRNFCTSECKCSYKLPSIYSVRKSSWTSGTIQMSRNLINSSN